MNETIVKHLNFGTSARDKVFEGINKLTQAVSSTLGASGKCVILEDAQGDPQITKDGVTVANAVILLDPVENMGAKLLKEAARKTVKEAGDGTTTATVLAHAILLEAYKVIKSEKTRDLKEGIRTGVDKVVKYLESIVKPVTGNRIKQVATISANNDDNIGNVISEAFAAVGNDGIVMMETNEDPDTIVEVIEGIQYDQPLKNAHFVTDKEKNTAVLENPLVLIVESEISNVRELQPVLEHVIKEKKSLLIIGNADPKVTAALTMNKVQGNIKVNIIDAPIYGLSKKEILSDLCAVTGARLISEDLGDDLDMIDWTCLGACVKATTSAQDTVIQVEIDDNEEVKDIIISLENQLKESSNPALHIRLEKRLAKLKAKLAVVKVGANSEVELKEKRDRVEDAICATKAAIKEGIVPGGGIALLNAAQSIISESVGESILLEAIKSPYNIILKNAGIDDYKTPTVKGKGLDVVTGKTVSMVKSGIIDPLLVTKSALRNAASVATTILSTDCVINNIRA